MTGRERLLAVLSREPTDTVPIFEFLHSRVMYRDLLGRCSENFSVSEMMELAQKVGYDFCTVPFGGLNGFGYEGGYGEYIDEWGVKYKKDPAAWPTDAPIEFPLRTGEDFKSYQMPDPGLPERLDGLRLALAMRKKDDMGILATVRGPYTNAWMLYGLENFSVMLYTEPDMVHETVEKVTDFSIEGARRAIDAGADAIMVADDYGSCHSPLISPEHFALFIKPHLERLCRAVHEKGKKIVIHCDGNINLLMDDIVSAGIDAYHPVERAANMDLRQIKQKYGNRITLFGNVDNKRTLVTGTPDNVVKEVKQCIEDAAAGGGYVLCADHSVHDDMSTENILAMYNAGRKFGKY